MIKILPPEQHQNGKKIRDCYLYLITCISPFLPAEVLGDDVIEIDGYFYDKVEFLDIPEKTFRKRDEAYRKLLEDNGFHEETKCNRITKLLHDSQLAAKLLHDHAKDVYQYLYSDGNHLDSTKLRKLLTTPMDNLQELPNFIVPDADSSDMLLKYVFRYDAFSKHKLAIRLLELMGANVCPYCNRMPTVTLSIKQGKSRPQFDHYLSKVAHPWFAISLLNLVPSCGLCNQTKSDRKDQVLYPYSEEMGTDVKFHTEIEKGVRYLVGVNFTEDEFSISLDFANKQLPDDYMRRVNTSKKYFNLVGLYNLHKEYILHIFKLRYVYTDTYLVELHKQFPEMFSSMEDIKSFIYLLGFAKDEWGILPFSKLTHDIDLEITQLIKS